LLATKLRPPRPRRTAVARPRLAGLAARSRQRALTLVSAPAGFGKTTLTADWFAGESATAWLSLDQSDDDPVRFWTYLLAAIESAWPELESDASTLLGNVGVPLDVVVATLINDLEAASEDLVVVLDDYHVITSIEIHDSISFLIDHLPQQVRLVIATRADPPLALAALRASGDLLEVRAADLRFTPDEAATYLSQAMDLAVTPEDVALLEARTEGWIAALQLAALSMQKQDDPSAFVAEFAGDDRFILDYLADEVLEHQTPEVRSFLLDTSILARLTGGLCAAVTGQSDARSTLEELDRSNLFLVPLDDRRTWYRYHHLFGDVLRARLLDGDADHVRRLHVRASDWYASAGDQQEAISHALAGGAAERAAELLELAAPTMQRARQEAQLRSWLEALPPELYVDRPVLAMALVGARMSTGDVTDLDPLFEIIDAWLAGEATPIVFDELAHRRLPAMASVHRAGLALLAGDTDATIQHASRVLELAHEEDRLQRGAAAALIGLAHWARGDLETARRRYVESITCFVEGDHLPDAMGCSIALADIQLAQGRLRDAQHTFEYALSRAEARPGLRGAADMHVGLALLAIERDDLDAAELHLRAGAELGEHMGLPQHPYRWRVATARLHQVNGDLDAAAAKLAEAADRYNTDYSPSVRPVAAMQARLAIERGDLGAALRWVDASGLDVDDELTYIHELEHLVLAEVLIARSEAGDLVDAVRLLERLLAAAMRGGRHGSAIEVGVVLARARQAQGLVDAAKAALSDALGLAEPEGYVRTFIDAGPVVVDLARSLGGDSRARAGRLIETTSSGARARPRASDPDELSDRELDVLRLLRSDLSGPDIARELHVSLNTLRTHTKHIYTKLGATNRREALTRAAERGL
jgi:LuxR family maltose regulon positive regulatory protein